MSNSSIDLHSEIAAVIGPLTERIDRILVEQQSQAAVLAQATARLDELAEQVATLRGQALWFEHRSEDAERYAYGARNIAMQAEHQMRQDIATLNERLLDVTADIHRLHLIREAPEHQLYTLRSDIAVLQQRLAQLESVAGTT